MKKYPDLSKVSEKSVRLTGNPSTYSQPDLFTSLGDTPNFVELDELSEEEVKALPFAAFTHEEWTQLPLSWQLYIWNGDPKTKKIKRLDFDTLQWDELEDEIKDAIYEQDEQSQIRIRSLANALVDASPDPTPGDILRDNEEEIDYRFGDEDWLWDAYGPALMERLGEDYPNIEWDEIEDEVREAAVEYGFSQANFEFEAEEGGYGDISARSPGYYLERDQLGHYFPQAPHIVGRAYYGGTRNMEPVGPPLDAASMPEDEIEKAISLADDEDPKFSDWNIDEKDVWSLIHDRWGSIDRESDYESWTISATPNWEEIVSDTVDQLDLEELEGSEAPRHYEEHAPEERILFRGRQLGSPEDIVETQRKPFALGDTYYAVDLIPSELKTETKRGRNCVGREENGYPAALRAGRIRLLSVRPETDENKWRRTYLLELVLDRANPTATLEELIEGGHIDHVEQIKGYNNRIPGFDRGLYEGGTHQWVSPEEATALLELVEDLNVKNPRGGTDTSRYLLPALERHKLPEPNPSEEPYSFNVHTKN